MKLKSTFRLILKFVFVTIVIESSSSFAQEEKTEVRVSPDSVVVIGVKIPKVPVFSSTATKLPIRLQTTPASVGVVTSPIIDTQDGIVLGDALRNISGVNVQTGFGVHDFFTIRGFDSLTSGLVLTDGAPEPEVTFYNLYNIERVEVLKGPGAFLYGSNPLSGAVNLVRKQPIFEQFFHLAGSYGQFESYRGTLDFGLADLAKGAAFRLNALWQDSENYRDDKSGKDISVNPALTWRLNDRSLVTVNFEYVNSDHHPDSGLPLVNNEIPDLPRKRSYQSPFDISKQQIYRLRIDVNSKVSELLTLRDKLYFTDLDWLSRGTLFNFTFPNASGSIDVSRTLPLLDDRQKLIGNQFESMLSFKTRSVKHTLLTGFEFSRLNDEFTLDAALLSNIDLFDPVETAAKPFFIIPGQSTAANARSLVFAPYFVDQVSFSEKYQLFFGGRFDIIDYQDEVTGTSRDDKKFSPMLGFVYSPNPTHSFYLNAGKAFAPPSSRVVGNRKPEESTQFELGTKNQFLDGNLVTRLALYSLKKDHIAVPDDNGLTQQTGDQRSRGVELEIVVRPRRNWHTFLSYAFSDAELTDFSEQIFIPMPDGSFVPETVDRSGNTPAFAPKHILNIWTMKEYNNGIGVGGGVRYVSGQFIAEDNVFEIDDFLTFDASFYYRIGNWKWSMNFKNLTDEEYETRGFGAISVIPANPFAVYSEVEFTL